MPDADTADDTDDQSSGSNTGSTLTQAQMDPSNNEYATPGEIWRPLADAVGGFDVDAASGAESQPIAPTRFTKEDDGLSQSWHGWTWLNPPWSTQGTGSAKEIWLRKALNESKRDAVDGVVAIIPSDTSTHWFHDQVLAADVICFVGPGRIPFVGESRNPSFPMLILVYGAVPDDLMDALDGLGAVFWGRQLYEPNPQAELPLSGGDD